MDGLKDCALRRGGQEGIGFFVLLFYKIKYQTDP